MSQNSDLHTICSKAAIERRFPSFDLNSPRPSVISKQSPHSFFARSLALDSARPLLRVILPTERLKLAFPIHLRRLVLIRLISLPGSLISRLSVQLVVKRRKSQFLRGGVQFKPSETRPQSSDCSELCIL